MQMNNGKTTTPFETNDAFHRAIQSGNVIEFDTPEEADDFSQNYKNVWPQKDKKTLSKIKNSLMNTERHTIKSFDPKI